MSTDEPSAINRWLAKIPVSWIGRLFLVSGLLFWVGGAYQSITGLDHDRSLEEKGRVVEGTVLEKVAGRKSTGRSSKNIYAVEFRFSPSRGEAVTSKVELDKEVWEQLQVAGPIFVTYLPGEPEIHRVEGQDAEFQLWKLFLAVAGGGVMLYVSTLLLSDEPRRDHAR